ncbi:hypothetical protein [Pseudarthrobacter sulfonivorans]|uniref:hypothetical protein n=1 Tax=Pseudarthrobacter sulfonivorans TaxID=121292 RepID=UPI0021044514|nr:hypothetical protein [Pseudarthrobacter sulfonivorans]
MSEDYVDSIDDHGPHQHAHVAPTTQQMRTVGQRRRDAEEKLEHHLQEARHKDEPHADEDSGPAPALGGGENASTEGDDRDRADLTAGQAAVEGEASPEN